jgi:hypothetical protein
MDGEGERLGRHYDGDGTGTSGSARRRARRLGAPVERYLELEFPRENASWVLRRARRPPRRWSLRALLRR